jgi:ribosomal protein S18 acetylase RimI-like enzyme
MNTIRNVGPDDWAAFRDIRLAALTDSPTAFAATVAEAASRSDAEWETMVRERCASDASATWVAEDPGGLAVGVVAAFADPTSHEVELVSMWVAPAARGAGLASRLVDVVIAWAEGRQAPAVSLWVMRGNEPAQRLYEAAGFAVNGEHQALPSDPCKDEIRMIRAARQRSV